MNKSDFYYDLPVELIAQHPIYPRDSSRLMVLSRDKGQIEHKHFGDILDYLNEGDCLVLNDTRVLPARLYGVKQPTGANVEILLLDDKGNDVWECLTRPGKRAKMGTVISFGDGLMKGTIIESLENGNRLISFDYEGLFLETLDKIGEMPLPHYITERLDDKERYQTVYSRELGSAAAPTAGLHFTPELLEKIKSKGVDIAYVTLHVGIGTFRPVKADKIEDHKMHSEHYSVSMETADIINNARAKGGKVVAVGTTCCRTLETVSAEDGTMRAASGSTNIFIYPGYKFKCIDALITNFHLPESTLIMLVSAFCGRENCLNAYNTAVNEKYRFFSFGDAMLLL